MRFIENTFRSPETLFLKTDISLWKGWMEAYLLHKSLSTFAYEKFPVK